MHLQKTLVLSIICSKYKNVDKKIFKEEELIKILKFLVCLKIFFDNDLKKYESKIYIKKFR